MKRARWSDLIRWIGLAFILGLPAQAQAAAAESAEIVQLRRLAPLIMDDPGQAEPSLRAMAARMAATEPERWRLYWAQARVAAALGQGEAVERLSQQVPAAGGPTAAGACALGLYQRQYVSARKAVQTLEPALAEEAAANLDPEVRVPCELGLARAYAARGQSGLSLRHARTAMVTADTQPDALPLRALARSNLARFLYATDDGERALFYSDEAIVLARQSGLATVLAQVLLDRSTLTPHEPAYANLRQQLRQEALRLWREARSARGIGVAQLNLADDALQAGDYVRAEANARAAVAVAERSQLGPDLSAMAHHNLGLALIGQGNTRGGVALSRQAIAELQRIEATQRVADLLYELATQLERAGHDAKAYAVVMDYRPVHDRIVTEDRQEAVADLQAQLEADVLHARQQAQRDEAALRAERERLADLRQRTVLVVAAVLSLVALLAAARYRVLRHAMRRRQREHAALAQLATQDALTGLANRQHALDRMGAMGVRAQGGLMLIDVDRFKRINDRHGHAAGDAVLVELAQRLRRAVRTDDLVARWGGEEFLVLVAEPARAGATAALAARLLADVAGEPVTSAVAQTPLAISVSIGLADWPTPADARSPTWDAALASIDAALYGAKLLGRNRAVVVFRPLAMPADAAAAQAALARGDWGHLDGKVVR
ncbi:MAG: GGDEF domain-containing protein [Proteobacteria bacterium]|nr:GGDEF domain-containing protein [Pseudomonadota bacterium]